MNRKAFLILTALILVGLAVSACGQETVTVVVTATPGPATATPVPPTDTPAETDETSSASEEASPEAGATGEGADAEPVDLPEQMSPSADAPGPEASAGRLALMGPYTNNFQVFVMNADGSGLRMVSDGQSESIFPSLSPDGSQRNAVVGYFTEHDEATRAARPNTAA